MTAPANNYIVSNCFSPEHDWHEVVLILAGNSQITFCVPSKAEAEQLVAQLWSVPTARMHELSETVLSVRAYMRDYDFQAGCDAFKPVFIRLPRLNIIASFCRSANIYITAMNPDGSVPSSTPSSQENINA